MFKNIFRQIPSISIFELTQDIARNNLVLDVRTPSEYRAGHIPFSKNIPLKKIDTYQGSNQTIYVICQSGVRSRQATKKLRKNGYDAINVRGGMNQWSGKVKEGK